MHLFEIAFEIDVELKWKKKIENEVIKSPQESFRIDYFYFFLYIVYR